MTLFDIKNLSRNETGHNRSYSKRLFENMNNTFGLPVEPQSTPWNRIDKESESLILKFKFSNRENAKDFVSSIQELEDRMQMFCNILINRNEIKISYELPESCIVSDRVKEFFSAIKSIEESIGE